MRLKALMLTVLFSGAVLQAQTDFRPGYVIELTGDTLFGEIDYRGDLMMGELCRLRISNNEIKTFYPNQIKAYRINDGNFYVARQIDEKYVFLEYLISGKVSVYYIKDGNGESYFIEKEGEELTRLPYETGIKYVEKSGIKYMANRSTPVVYKSTLHIGYLKYYMQDYPAIFEKVEHLDRLSKNNLIRLAEGYHNGVSVDEPYEIYEVQKPVARISVEPLFGINCFIAPFDQIKMFPGIAGNIYLSFPRADERVSLKMGLESIRSFEEGKDLSIYKFPLQIQYMYPVYKIKPKIGTGINIYNVRIGDYRGGMYTNCFSGGLNVSVKENIDLSFNCVVETIPLFANEEKFLFSSSIYFGLFFYL